MALVAVSFPASAPAAPHPDTFFQVTAKVGGSYTYDWGSEPPPGTSRYQGGFTGKTTLRFSWTTKSVVRFGDGRGDRLSVGGSISRYRYRVIQNVVKVTRINFQGDRSRRRLTCRGTASQSDRGLEDLRFDPLFRPDWVGSGRRGIESSGSRVRFNSGRETTPDFDCETGANPVNAHNIKGVLTWVVPRPPRRVFDPGGERRHTIRDDSAHRHELTHHGFEDLGQDHAFDGQSAITVKFKRIRARTAKKRARRYRRTGRRPDAFSCRTPPADAC